MKAGSKTSLARRRLSRLRDRLAVSFWSIYTLGPFFTETRLRTFTKYNPNAVKVILIKQLLFLNFLIEMLKNRDVCVYLHRAYIMPISVAWAVAPSRTPAMRPASPGMVPRAASSVPPTCPLRQDGCELLPPTAWRLGPP